ncbi:D-2-hydroxyacid dehydrogenase [Bifidobacterium tibiigranuli]|jgi:D-lactate dehydrogenase|uniref:D-2-hydroxyacid dehydrogenase n=1 Tax=Bifidobacterium tibiigranuli TaxID=2172043 RepID=UPI0026EC8AEE|nr:D-2-hydroxyacid dehydrogenase [Bifidobacterium tibiigranuli]MCI1650202.1 D-2-hydroxyacid dehydrogenase [Bifidobacterium tibiigranuli]MCI1673893.1 D-2-hydroxyacid dehydrogenase [Bifidobacterium tibiigranuli]MCI1712142.1 D-2-hydroxyacid dehydrogenase [Bifidobacterium tibiigranuli]MCI1834254.1 D-2-hydroxyacid dehydrogenase [Bifidobacterium tibiigranuli]MCI2185748.1 D-2-hydroxyacid dehydrogenase [Bifidobacterium tibiigranuli]
MTSIAFYHTIDEEEPFAQQWAHDHNVHVECFPFELHEDTLHTIQGFDGISYKQRSAPSDNPDFYRRLAEYGIRQIAIRSAGYDTIDLHAAHQNNIRITNVPSYSPSAVAELTLTHIMRLIRHIPQFDDQGSRHDFSVRGLISREISELTIGIIGVGRIGSTVARIFHALGARVLGNDITENHELDSILTWVSKDDLLAQADVVTMHTYLDSTTRHLIDAHRLAQMKPSAYFVNASRGPVVDTPALIEALQHHRIAGAAIDVLEGEATLFGNTFDADKPLANEAYNTLYAMPNVIITPHIAFFTDIAIKNMTCQSLDDALAIINGGTSPHEIKERN